MLPAAGISIFYTQSFRGGGGGELACPPRVSCCSPPRHSGHAVFSGQLDAAVAEYKNVISTLLT